MRLSCNLPWACVLALLLHAAPALAQSLDQVPLEKRMSILEDKVFLNFPTTAAYIQELKGPEFVQFGPHDQTRILYIHGADTLLVWVVNEFQFAKQDMRATWADPNNEANKRRSVLIDRDGLVAALVAPETLTAQRGKILLRTLEIGTPDNLTFIIKVELNAAAMPEAQQYIQLSTAILSTMQPGNPDKGLAPRQEKLPIDGMDYAVLFDLPARYHVRSRNTLDMNTFFVYPYSDADAPHTWGEVVMEFGRVDPLDAALDPNVDANPKEVKGKFLGNEVTWLQYQVLDYNGLHGSKLSVPCPALGPGIHVNVFIYAADKTSLKAMTEIAERIQLVAR